MVFYIVITVLLRKNFQWPGKYLCNLRPKTAGYEMLTKYKCCVYIGIYMYVHNSMHTLGKTSNKDCKILLSLTTKFY